MAAQHRRTLDAGNESFKRGLSLGDEFRRIEKVSRRITGENHFGENHKLGSGVAGGNAGAFDFLQIALQIAYRWI
jgi:hypothetical protein